MFNGALAVSSCHDWQEIKLHISTRCVFTANISVTRGDKWQCFYTDNRPPNNASRLPFSSNQMELENIFSFIYRCVFWLPSETPLSTRQTIQKCGKLRHEFKAAFVYFNWSTSGSLNSPTNECRNWGILLLPHQRFFLDTSWQELALKNCGRKELRRRKCSIPTILSEKHVGTIIISLTGTIS